MLLSAQQGLGYGFSCHYLSCPISEEITRLTIVRPVEGRASGAGDPLNSLYGLSSPFMLNKMYFSSKDQETNN